MKNKILFMTTILMFSAMFLHAQDKKIKIKVIKNEDGEVFMLDTTFESNGEGDVYFYSHGDINQEKIDSLLKSLDIDNEHGIQFIGKNLEVLDSGQVKHIWISKTGDEESDLDKQAILEMLEGEKFMESTNKFALVQGDSLKITKEFIYHDGAENVYVTSKDGKKILVSTSSHSGSFGWSSKDSSEKIITITSDVDVTTDAQGYFKVISTSSSSDEDVVVSEIRIKKGEGDCKTVKIFIDEDEFDGENKWLELEEMMEGSGEKIKILKYKTDDGMFMVKAEISDCELNDEEQQQAKDIGLEDKLELKLNKFKLYPNPTEGAVTVELELETKDNVLVKVFNQQGKSIYTEKIKKFNGFYSNEIDLSKEESGLYFIKIIQGDKSVTKKILKK